jgi:hypothetical protein
MRSWANAFWKKPKFGWVSLPKGSRSAQKWKKLHFIGFKVFYRRSLKSSGTTRTRTRGQLILGRTSKPVTKSPPISDRLISDRLSVIELILRHANQYKSRQLIQPNAFIIPSLSKRSPKITQHIITNKIGQCQSHRFIKIFIGSDWIHT